MPFDVETYRKLYDGQNLGRDVHYAETTTSTLDDARAAADASLMDSCGGVYVAGEQTAGRGRQGRQWASPPGSGLYATYHLCRRETADPSLFSIAAALAAADAIRDAAGLVLDVKWPNDLLHEGRKVAGILSEARYGAMVEVFIGIGINVRAASLPPDLKDIATSIEEATGSAPTLEALLAALSVSLEQRAGQVDDAPEVLVEEWRTRLVTLGNRVRLATPDGRIHEGEAVDVTLRGEIVLRHDDGTLAQYAAGDVTASA